MSVEVAQNNFNAVESENNVFNDNVGGRTSDGREYGREYSGRNNQISYQVNFTSNGNVQGATDYGSQPNSGAFMNTSVGYVCLKKIYFGKMLNFFVLFFRVTPINYTVGAQYPPEAVHMPPEMIYPQSVVYTGAQQSNPYGVVHAATAPSAAAAAAAPAPVPAYEPRPNVSIFFLKLQEENRDAKF